MLFHTDALQWVLTIASGLVAVVLGLWVIVRPNTAILLWSISVGIAWLIIFAVLTAQQTRELVAWPSDAFLAVIGVAASVVGYAAARDRTVRFMQTMLWFINGQIGGPPPGASLDG